MPYSFCRYLTHTNRTDFTAKAICKAYYSSTIVLSQDVAWLYSMGEPSIQSGFFVAQISHRREQRNLYKKLRSAGADAIKSSRCRIDSPVSLVWYSSTSWQHWLKCYAEEHTAMPSPTADRRGVLRSYTGSLYATGVYHSSMILGASRSSWPVRTGLAMPIWTNQTEGKWDWLLLPMVLF